jgi:ABC-type bacteriocin/lantibiotic exporter with double-glycine peptidase domain
MLLFSLYCHTLLGYGQAYQFPWVWWAALFACAISLISLCINTILFSRIRFRTVASAKQPVDDITIEGISDDQEGMQFQAANLTFTDICYSVKSSDGKETIELLKGVDGYVAAGKMTALMGSSGAGKTTLLDVLALRKTSGEISGEVRVNGHLQDPNSFRRCTGYVEQVRRSSIIAALAIALTNALIYLEIVLHYFF